jgi:quercetin dioxygenase-like cupin family protein
VDKVWGHEVWVVNCPDYCCKLLHVDKGALCSYHRHPKKETFYVLEGEVSLTIDGEDTTLVAKGPPITIEPRQWHCFHGNTRAVILEVSTYDDGQVERLTQSQPGEKDA